MTLSQVKYYFIKNKLKNRLKKKTSDDVYSGKLLTAVNTRKIRVSV